MSRVLMQGLIHFSILAVFATLRSYCNALLFLIVFLWKPLFEGQINFHNFHVNIPKPVVGAEQLIKTFNLS